MLWRLLPARLLALVAAGCAIEPNPTPAQEIGFDRGFPSSAEVAAGASDATEWSDAAAAPDAAEPGDAIPQEDAGDAPGEPDPGDPDSDIPEPGEPDSGEPDSGEPDPNGTDVQGDAPSGGDAGPRTDTG